MKRIYYKMLTLSYKQFRQDLGDLVGGGLKQTLPRSSTHKTQRQSIFEDTGTAADGWRQRGPPARSNACLITEDWYLDSRGSSSQSAQENAYGKMQHKILFKCE